ncbi:urea transporter [Stutzerimonas chloritidismutans]|uniref:urea transporter n=1 Tax=Stutzerimonas chloritidismutans TaxID=203192 RepID=UPI003F138E23
MTPFLPQALLNGVSQILLQSHPGCGLLILLAIGLQDLTLLAGALLGLGVGTGLALRLGYPQQDIATGLYGYNPTLLGLLVALTLGATPVAGGLIVLTAGLSVPLQGCLLGRLRGGDGLGRCAHGAVDGSGRASIVRPRPGLPGYTLAFVLLGWLALGLCGLMDEVVAARLPEPAVSGMGALGGMLQGLGQILFLSAPGAGLCLLVALLWADRSAALWALCGSAVGLYATLLVGGSDAQALAGLASYNPALAALALSQVSRSAVAPALGILLALLGNVMFDRLGLPPLTMPFILASWAVTLGMRWHDGRPPRWATRAA